MPLPRALTPLGERNFRLLWLGQGISAVGDSITPVALAFATISLNGSASALGLVMATSTLAQVIALPIGGVWADRLPRQLVMLGSDALRAAVYAVLGGLLVSHHAQLWELIVSAVVYNFAGGFFQPASSSVVPRTVAVELLQQANALMGLSRSATNVAGPVISGLLVAVVNPGWVLALDSLTFVVSALSLALLRIPRASDDAGRAGFWRELVEGVQAVTRRRWYLINLGAHAVWNFAIAAFFVLGPIVAKHSLGGPSAWGLISASLGVGALLGGLIALRVTPSKPLLVANLALIPAALQLVAIAVPAPVPVIMAACVVGWVGLTFLNEVWFATVPQLIPSEVLARATSFDWLLSLIGMPAGFAVFGPLADRFGVTPPLLVAAALLALSGLVAFVPGVRSVRRTPEGRIVAGGPAETARTPR
jgi:MFS family permease